MNSSGRKTAAVAILALVILAASFLGAALLLDIRVRLHLSSLGFPVDQSTGRLPWAAASTLIIGGSSSAGLAWRRRIGPVRPVFPVLLAVLGPVLVVMGAASFYFPFSWPAWIDSELVGAAAILSGAVLSVLLAPSFLTERRSLARRLARALLCLWGALIVIAGTGAALFLE